MESSLNGKLNSCIHGSKVKEFFFFSNESYRNFSCLPYSELKFCPFTNSEVLFPYLGLVVDPLVQVTHIIYIYIIYYIWFSQNDPRQKDWVLQPANLAIARAATTKRRQKYRHKDLSIRKTCVFPLPYLLNPTGGHVITSTY